jgi:hAT family C-terminal dimerisation region
VVTGLLQVIDRIHYNDEQARAAALMQFNEFCFQNGIFGMPIAQQYAKQVSAHKYWNMFDEQVAALRKVAMRVLSKVTSSSACKRNWSAFEAVQSLKRNRLKSSTLNDLAFTRVNLRLQQARLESDHASTVPEWSADSLAKFTG